MAAKAKSKDKRDNFTAKTITALAQRAGYCCSVPNCGKLTVGPALPTDKAFNQGTAAHIISASRTKGPRLDVTATPQQRKSIENGIWCCATHGRLIDSDETRYPKDLLRQWKRDHEERVLLQATGRLVGRGMVTSVTIDNVARFKEPLTVQFGKKTLIYGASETGKTIIGDIVAGLGDLRNALAWKNAKSDRTVPAVIQYEVFCGTKMHWQLTFGNEPTYLADNNPVPTIFSGFRIFHLRDRFHPSPVEIDETEFDKSGEQSSFGASWDLRAKSLIDDLARLTQLSRESLLTTLKIMSIAPGCLWEHIKLDGEKLSAKVKENYFEFTQLSSSEQNFVILDLLIRLAEYSARFSPTILILDQQAFPSFDESNLTKLIERLGGREIEYQLIIPISRLPESFTRENWTIVELERGASASDPVKIK